MLIVLLYNQLKNNGKIDENLLQQILELEDLKIKKVVPENMLITKKNYDKYERRLSDLIDNELDDSSVQIYDSNDDILTLAYKLALLKNKDYDNILAFDKHNNYFDGHRESYVNCNDKNKSTFNILSTIVDYLIIILIVLFIVVVVICIINKIFEYKAKHK